MMEDSPFFDQLRIAHWDTRLEFDTGQKVYTHRFVICAAFQFFEGLCEAEIERNLYQMPPSEDQPVTADMLCLMLSFLYEDWHIPGVTNDRTKATARFWDIKRAADFLGVRPGAMKALTGPCRCCECPTTRYAKDMPAPGTSGICPCCWEHESPTLTGQQSDKGDVQYQYHITDSNVAWESREEVNAKIIAVGGFTLVPHKVLYALTKQIQASCPIVDCMTFQNLLASFLVDGLRLATEQVQPLVDAVGPDACMRVYALIYSCMLCPWECPEDAPHVQSFLVECNVPWCTIRHTTPRLKFHSLKDKTFMSADASQARPFITCTCGQCPGNYSQY